MDKDYIEMDMLRFTTAGSVDDGKSTLIGRLFHDTKSIFEDQLEAIEQSSKKRGDEVFHEWIQSPTGKSTDARTLPDPISQNHKPAPRLLVSELEVPPLFFGSELHR